MKRTVFLVLLAALAIGFGHSNAGADFITTLEYTESEKKGSFKWIFEWSGLLPPQPWDLLFSPPNQQYWSSELTFWRFQSDPQAQYIQVITQHLDGPCALDIDPGMPCRVATSSIAVLTVWDRPSWTRQSYHDHVYSPHLDILHLSYRRTTADGPVEFTLLGSHVPEPEGLLALAAGIAGLTSLRRRDLLS